MYVTKTGFGNPVIRATSLATGSTPTGGTVGVGLAQLEADHRDNEDKGACFGKVLKF
ncbi:MAG: hypothetical protein GJU73_07030 [Ferrovum sp.]|jgi:hypothetical protein|nr:hypothetical protein [Ferrovum sp.]